MLRLKQKTKAEDVEVRQRLAAKHRRLLWKTMAASSYAEFLTGERLAAPGIGPASERAHTQYHNYPRLPVLQTASLTLPHLWIGLLHSSASAALHQDEDTVAKAFSEDGNLSDISGPAPVHNHTSGTAGTSGNRGVGDDEGGGGHGGEHQHHNNHNHNMLHPAAANATGSLVGSTNTGSTGSSNTEFERRLRALKREEEQAAGA